IGGSLGLMHARKMCHVMDMAARMGAPLIGLCDSAGARVQEGVDALSGYGQIFYRNSIYSGVIPQISAIMGPCAGGAVYSPALTDFTFMVDKTGLMFITGPVVIKAVTGEEVTMEDLGGARVHNQISGNADFFTGNDEECLQRIRELLSYLPSNNLEDPPIVETGDDPNRMEEDLVDIVPVDPKRSYDMREVIKRVMDNGAFLEVKEQFARNIITCFARLNGRTVGIIANQPLVSAGVLDVDSSDKAARFIRFCDAFNIPIVNFVDVPGYMPGVKQEYSGIIRHGAKMLFAYSEATVPKITVITRKAYGGAYLAMCSKDLGADHVFAWPTAEIAVMGPEGAVDIIFRREIKGAEKPEEVRQRRVFEYRDKFANPYYAASKQHIDSVIDPRETRPRLIDALEMLLNKREARPAKKHANIPL
ncbi:MAG: acyl-CoA carboxylase subunit beta, partial [Candidatus Geothermarchaeales archaeon]